MADTLVPITFDEQARLGEENFTWSFLRASYNTWAMAHIVNPFLIQMIFQRWYVTVLAFCLWESVETFFLLVLKNYSIFFGDDSDFEPVADSLVGDQINGFLGLLLAWNLSLLVRFPRNWTPSVFSDDPRERRVFWKRLLLYACMAVPISAYNARISVDVDAQDVYAGVHVVMLVHVGALTASWLWLDDTDYQKRRYWSENSAHYGEGGPMAPPNRSLAYVAWMAALAVLHYGTTYFVTYPYYQAWLTWALVLYAVLFVMLMQGRLREWFFLATFGGQRRRNRSAVLKAKRIQ